MDRDDNDVYRVLITTDFGEEDIPLGPRRAEVSFQIEVKGMYSEMYCDVSVFHENG